MASFTPPLGALFLGTLGSPERAFLVETLSALRQRYPRFVEPCCGLFATTTIARAAGYPQASIDATDIGLLQSALGYAITGRSLEELKITVDGAPLELVNDPLSDFALVAYTQLRIRMELKPANAYHDELRTDLRLRETSIRWKIREQAAKLAETLAGIQYRPLGLIEHIAETRDDAKAVIVLSPPTYKAGYERFYRLGDRIKWAEPSYAMFDPKTGHEELFDSVKDARALVIVYQEAPAGESAFEPIWARQLSPGRYAYLWTNRPDEIKHRAVEVSAGRKLQPLDVSILPPDYELTPASKIEVAPITLENANYYRTLWLHRIAANSAPKSVGFFVDGYLAGLAGYEQEFVGRSVQTGSVMLTYGIAVPGVGRLGRLITRLALSYKAASQVLPVALLPLLERFTTTEFTPHPEAKRHRGIMSLERRLKDKKFGFKLTYASPVDRRPLSDILADHLKAESKYAKAQQSSGVE